MFTFMKESLPTWKAIESANARFSNDDCSRLEQLPNNIKVTIIGLLIDPVSIFNLSLTGPRLCAVVCTYEKKITRDVMSALIPSGIMYLAVAQYIIMATTISVGPCHYKRLGRGREMPWPNMELLLDFVDKYPCPEELTLGKQHPEGLCLSHMGHYIDIYKGVWPLCREAVERNGRVVVLSDGNARYRSYLRSMFGSFRDSAIRFLAYIELTNACAGSDREDWIEDIDPPPPVPEWDF
ncbi:hypothetical protein F5Y08DRAFT_341996 [Xylaria arbuscula]|nr:hypothetical protein F5Y08DRAFT_341996 [Xylaria arbuscula]